MEASGHFHTSNVLTDVKEDLVIGLAPNFVWMK